MTHATPAAQGDTGSQLPAVDPDGSRMLTAAMLMVVIGMDTFIIQPGFVQGLVDYAGFDDKQAGYVASAEMFGITATTVAMTWLAARVSWRRLAVLGLGVDAAANLFCVATTDFHTFATLRFVVGLASGVLISIGYTVVALTPRPDRNFGLLIMWVLTYGALALLIMPSVFAKLGLEAVLTFLAAAACLSVLLVRHLPTGAQYASPASAAAQPISILVRGLLLGGVLCYFLAQGVVWPYLSLIGVSGGGTEQQVAIGLTVAQILGIAGAWTAATAGTRLRHSTSLIAGILGGVVPMFVLLTAGGALVFGAAVGIFNYAANFVTPLLMAVVASFDRSGRIVVHAVALQMLGLAAGPALGAVAIDPGQYAAAVCTSIVLALVCLGLFLPAVISQSRAQST
jgi:predicted MFS family arabinose efflux permease